MKSQSSKLEPKQEMRQNKRTMEQSARKIEREKANLEAQIKKSLNEV